MKNFVPTPPWAPDLSDGEAIAVLYLCRAWSTGHAPSVRDIVKRCGIGNGTALAIRAKVHAWATDSGVPTPPDACPDGAMRRSTGTPPAVPQERETAPQTPEPAYHGNGSERSAGTPRAITHAPAVPCGRERERSENNLTRERAPATPAPAALTVPTTWDTVTRHPQGLDALPWSDGGAALLRYALVAGVTVDTLRNTSERDLGFRQGLTGGKAGELCRWLARWGLVVGDLVKPEAPRLAPPAEPEAPKINIMEVFNREKAKRDAERDARINQRGRA